MDRRERGQGDFLRQQLALAAHHVTLHAPERASAALDRIAAQALEEPRFWLLRALVAVQTDDPQEAVHAATEGLSRAPQSVPLLVVLGSARIELGDLVGAEGALLKALAVDPEDVDALCAYALAAARAGQVDKAQRLVQRAAAQAPDGSTVLKTRYHVADLAGDDREARRAAEELVRIEGSADAWLVLGAEAAKRMALGEALQLLQRAAREDVRVLDSFGPEPYRALRLGGHPLLRPFGPFLRWGAAPFWVAGVSVVYWLRVLDRNEWLEIAVGVSASCLVYIVLAACFVRWRLRR